MNMYMNILYMCTRVHKRKLNLILGSHREIIHCSV